MDHVGSHIPFEEWVLDQLSPKERKLISTNDNNGLTEIAIMEKWRTIYDGIADRQSKRLAEWQRIMKEEI